MAPQTHAEVERILTVDSPESHVEAEAGGKGLNLFRLTRAGFAVPRWAILSADVFDRFCARADIADTIGSALGDDSAAGGIAAAFDAAVVDDETAEAIETAYEQAGAGAVAVRSSGVDEDGERLSFAGQYTSFLNVIGARDVIDCVKACWASAYSQSALAYRRLNGLGVHGQRLAVIIQEIVPAATSGVLFTVNPAADDELVISSTYGLGEPLVSGSVDADTIRVERATGAVRATTIGDKQVRVDAAPGRSGCVTSSVPADQRDALSLADGDVAALHAVAGDVERLYEAPQDVEWAIADGRVWILQSRPITGRSGAARGEIRVWDNSNIIESFGEVTAPLTFSFAQNVYTRVYRSLCELLGVPAARLEEMDEWLPQMLGWFDGRVYYNVLNWYRVIWLLPAWRLQRRILATAMGVRETSAELADAQRPFEVGSRARTLELRARVAVRYWRYFFTTERLVARFLDEFKAVQERFEAADYRGRPADEIYRTYTEFERALLSRWGPTAVLDFVISLSYGALHVLGERWLPDAPEWFKWHVVRVASEVESALPAERLTELAQSIERDPELARLVREGDPTALERDRGDRTAWLHREVRRYLHDFGDRNVNELKLEEPDLRDDPSLVYAMLRDALMRAGAPEGADGAPADPDAYLDDNLRGWRRPVYEVVRGKVRRALRAREQVRFARTRAFGMARRLFRAMGDDMARTGAIADSGDVFYLRLEELRGAFGGTIAHRELRPLAEMRRRMQQEQARSPRPPARFVTQGSIYWGERRSDTPAPPDAGDGVRLRGTPCSAGVAAGEARVVTAPRDVGGDILVTYRTDPGWVGALSSASALLIERGSPLTHVAVVARELGIPTVVQIPGLTERVKTGMKLTVDGGSGTVDVREEM